MKSKLFYLLITILIVSNCSKKSEDKGDTYYRGDMTLVTDESFKSVTEALVEGYKIQYPDSNINIKIKKEDLAMVDVINGKEKIAVLSKPMDSTMQKAFTNNTGQDYHPDNFAADAVVFVVPKSSSKTSISWEEINQGLDSGESPFIFDGTNSSNINFVAYSLGKAPGDLNFTIINGNENLINRLGQFPNKIGVIALNSISRPYSKSAKELRDKITILAVEKNGKTYLPNQPNLKEMVYPFTRVMYFLTNEAAFGMAHGFIRYSCTQIGQRIVQKEGLQPYYVYKREVQIPN